MEMTVQELIERLKEVGDKTKGVWTLNGFNELRPNIEIFEYKDSIEVYAKE